MGFRFQFVALAYSPHTQSEKGTTFANCFCMYSATAFGTKCEGSYGAAISNFFIALELSGQQMKFFIYDTNSHTKSCTGMSLAVGAVANDYTLRIDLSLVGDVTA